MAGCTWRSSLGHSSRQACSFYAYTSRNIMSIESQANLTAAEQAAIPLISRAGLNLLRMHSLRVVAEHDIGTIQAAYLRLIEHTSRLVSQLGNIGHEYALLT